MTLRRRTNRIRWAVASLAVALAALLLPGAVPAAPSGESAERLAPDIRAPAEVPAVAADPARDSVVAVVHRFHEHLAVGDSVRALELLHPELVVYEGGHAEDLGEYRSGHLGADMEFSGAVDREVLSEEVTLLGTHALYLSEYRMAGDFRGRTIDAHGTETMVLERTDEGWRIRHIHWSSR